MSYTTRKASALGRAPLVSTSQGIVPTGIRSIEVNPYGGGGGIKPPDGPSGGGGGGPRPPGPRLPIGFPVAPMVKLPGSVISVGPTKGESPGKLPEPEKVPSRGGGIIVSGGGGGYGVGPRAANVGPLEPLPQPPASEEEVVEPTPAPPPPKSDNMLLYAAIGAGALWLLTRK